MKPDNANVFNPGNRSNTPTKELPKNGRSSVGSTIKTIVLFPVTFVMALIFAKRLGS